MNHWSWLVLLAACLASATSAGGTPPPPELASYFEAVRQADAAAVNDEQRCLAYPDLPGNDWPQGAAKARCVLLRAPIYSLEQIDALLDKADGPAQLDKRFGALLDAHYADPAQREQIFIAYFIFDKSTQAERVASRWLAASPDSMFAKMAMGDVYARQGWAARGGKYARDTPASSLQAMTGYFEKAVALLGDVLKQDKRMLPACEQLAGIGRMSSDELQNAALSICIQSDPDSYFVVEEMMTAAEPHWGGSMDALRVASAYASAHARENPMLHVFAVDFTGYAAYRDSDWDRKLRELEPVTRVAPNAAYLRDVGKAYSTKDQDWKAWVHLSQALRFNPKYANESRLRAWLLLDFGYPRWALADARRAVQLEPGNGYAQYVLGLALHDVEGHAAARPHYLLAMDDAKTREAAYSSYCRTWLQAKDQEQSDACTAKLVAEYPQNGEAWRLRAGALNMMDDPRFAHAMDQFMRYHDVNRWPGHARLVDEAKKRMAAPQDEFSARESRAMKMERSPDGKKYLMGFMQGIGDEMTEMMGDCFDTGSHGKTDAFTMVADIQADGSITDVEVRPSTKQTECYAERFGRLKAPLLPEQLQSAGFPVVIHASQAY